MPCFAGCGGSGGNEGATAVTGEPISFEQLSQAAATSSDASSARFSFSMEMTMPGADEPFAFTGEGAFDTAADQAAVSLDLSSFAELLGGMFAGMSGTGVAGPDFGDPSGWQIDAVQDGTVMYLRFPAMASELPAGKSWVRMDLTQAAKAQGFDFAGLQDLAGNDPRKMLDFLRAASDEIETVGTEELDGVPTTHYRAQVDLAEYAKRGLGGTGADTSGMLNDLFEQSGLASAPVDVWLDESGLVRKLEMTFSAAPPGTTESVDASMSFELFDYGEPVSVNAPPPAEVVDASALD